MEKPTNPLVATVRMHGQLAVIDMAGDIDGFADETLEKAYGEADASGAPAVLLNFDNVDYINSTGIALIVGMLAKARMSHKQLMTCGLSDHYQEIFNITRLSDFMNLYPDEDSALKDVTTPAS
ncbi:MAG: STAS domain-containing protein [Chloroflexota bacterium]